MIRTLLTWVVLMCSAALCAQNPTMEWKRSKQKMQCRHKGIRRCLRYDVWSADVPKSFEGAKLVFVTDVHYPSRFDDRSLASLDAMLQELQPDMLLLGGDYQEDCEHVEPLMRVLGHADAHMGKYAVLGNNDYERCTDVILESLRRNGITMIEQSTDTVWRGTDRIVVAGVRNTFAARETMPSPIADGGYDDFVILLTHTPDYVEDMHETHADLSLAGHTHGGQVALLGWAPKNPSHYGRQMLRGMCYTADGAPVMVSNGIGTSRMAVRFGAATEITLIVLHHKD